MAGGFARGAGAPLVFVAAAAVGRETFAGFSAPANGFAPGDGGFAMATVVAGFAGSLGAVVVARPSFAGFSTPANGFAAGAGGFVVAAASAGSLGAVIVARLSLAGFSVLAKGLATGCGGRGVATATDGGTLTTGFVDSAGMVVADARGLA